MFVYSLSPIDDWRGWQRPEDLFRPAIDTSPEASPTGKDDPLGAFEPHRWARAWTSARAAARKLQWKGDIRPGGGPYITILPAAEPGGLPLFVIAWKQQDNGATFVASPVRLSWLEVDGNEWLVPDHHAIYNDSVPGPTTDLDATFDSTVSAGAASGRT